MRRRRNFRKRLPHLNASSYQAQLRSIQHQEFGAVALDLPTETLVDRKLWKFALAAILQHRPCSAVASNTASLAQTMQTQGVLEAECNTLSNENLISAILTLAHRTHAPFRDQTWHESLGAAQAILEQAFQASALFELIEPRNDAQGFDVFVELLTDSLVFLEWLVEVDFVNLKADTLEYVLHESVLYAPHQDFCMKVSSASAKFP